MNTIQKLSSLFKKLDTAEALIEKYQKTLSPPRATPYRSIKRALSQELSIKLFLEREIIKICPLVEKEVELLRLEKEYSLMVKSMDIGAIVDHTYIFSLEDSIKNLKDEIN